MQIFYLVVKFNFKIQELYMFEFKNMSSFLTFYRQIGVILSVPGMYQIVFLKHCLAFFSSLSKTISV